MIILEHLSVFVRVGCLDEEMAMSEWLRRWSGLCQSGQRRRL